jgi:hypothetical protein
MQSELKFHLRGTAPSPDPPHFGSVGRRFIAGITNRKRESLNRIRDRQVAYETLMQSELKFHLRVTAPGPHTPHFGMVGRRFIAGKTNPK